MDRRTKTFLTIGLMVGLLISSLDTTVVDTAFPRIVAELHGEAIFTWVLTIYMLTSTAIVPMIGKLADTHGRKAFFLGGVALFVGGSVLCGLAQSMGQLILFRGIQGLGGGMLLPIAYTIVGDVYPGEQRATVQAFLSMVWGIASTVGPKLGGWLTQYYSWRWIFFINLPIGLISMAIMLFAYKESRGEQRPIDWLGSTTLTSAITLFLIAVARGGEAWPWLSWQSLGLFGASAVLICAFAQIEKRVEEPVIAPALLRNRMFTATNLAGFIGGAAMFCAILYVPWFIQGIGGVDPNHAGNMVTPMMIALGAATMLTGRLALRFPYRYLFSAGFILLGAGYWLMAGWDVNTVPIYMTLTSLVTGAGMGMIVPMLTPTLQNTFPKEMRGVVTSASQFFRQIGSTVGLTVAGVIFNRQMAHSLTVKLAAGTPGGQAAAPFFQQASADPQVLVRLLLNPGMQEALPASVREQVVALVKSMMAHALQTVFWAVLASAAVGLLVVQFQGNTSLKRQLASQAAAAD